MMSEEPRKQTKRAPRDRRIQQPFNEEDKRVNDHKATAKEERKNPPFVQLSIHKMPDLRLHMKANPTAVTVLLFLAEHMGQDNLVIAPQKVIEEELEMSRASVYRAIKYLSDQSLICVVKFGSTNGYAVNGSMFWKAWHGPDRYLVFEKVRALASREENKKTHARLKHLFATQGELFEGEEDGEDRD